MRKLVLALFLASAAFGFFSSPASAADPPQAAPVLSAADQAFIASLAAPVKTPEDPPRTARRPPRRGAGAKALCTATANCESGTVSCEGNNSSTSCSAADRNCPGEQGHVTCDGVTTWCPTACPCTCGQLQAACAAECYPCPYTFNCTDPQNCDYFCHCRFSGCF